MPVTTVRLGGRPHQPVLLLGPAAGTSVQALWGATARELSRDLQVVGWDLPGHGTNARFDVDDPRSSDLSLHSLARDLLDALDRLLDTAPGVVPTPVHLAGHGAGAAVSLLLAAAHPTRVATLTLLDGWRQGAAGEPASPTQADPGAVALVRRAHGDADDLEAILDSLRSPALVETAHPAEQPERVAALVRRHALGLDDRGEDDATDATEATEATGALDARTESLVQVAIAAATSGWGDDLLAAARAASRHGATAGAIGRAVTLARGSEDPDGHHVAELLASLRAAR